MALIDLSAPFRGPKTHQDGEFEYYNIYDGDLLGSEAKIQGPAVVELETTAVVVPHQFALSCDQMRNFILTWKT